MTTRQENRMSSLLAVRKQLNENISIWGGVVTFAMVVSLFIAKIVLIQQTEMKQKRSTKGITGGKKTKQNELIEKMIEGASAIQSFASDTKNEDLYELVNYGEGELENMADSLLKDRGQLILDTVNAHAADLVGEGFDGADILELQTLVNDYEAALPAPKNAISNKKTATSFLKTLFTEVTDLLEKNLDKKMVQFKKSHPEFYSDYINNREIIDLGTRHTRLGGTITDSNGNPLYDVIITAEGADLTETTDTEGEYLFKPFIPGIFNIKFEKAGFETQTIMQVEVGRGENKTLDIVLQTQGGGGTGSTMSGTVKDSAMMPIGGAKLELLGTTFMVFAKPDGTYLMTNVPSGNYTLRVSATGYMTKDIPVAVPASGDVVVDVVL